MPAALRHLLQPAASTNHLPSLLSHQTTSLPHPHLDLALPLRRLAAAAAHVQRLSQLAHDKRDELHNHGGGVCRRGAHDLRWGGGRGRGSSKGVGGRCRGFTTRPGCGATRFGTAGTCSRRTSLIASNACVCSRVCSAASAGREACGTQRQRQGAWARRCTAKSSCAGAAAATPGGHKAPADKRPLSTLQHCQPSSCQLQNTATRRPLTVSSSACTTSLK